MRVERQDAARPLAVRQVEVLGVGAEWIRAVAAAGHGDPVAGTDERYLVVELPLLGSRAPSALELDVDRHDAPSLSPAGVSPRAYAD
jgi:hypothetical protein